MVKMDKDKREKGKHCIWKKRRKGLEAGMTQAGRLRLARLEEERRGLA